ncbi:unnamed protein product [Durusdinium trenchii]|uniref:Uncharacterized protein n=2 Tax=Durusdinium trenchii TaxID=1381693 RepID=A0ABP0HUY1_9DINO
MALYWLEQVLGDWGDSKGNRYEVSLDETGFSCSVRTTRKGGRIQTTHRMLKYNSKTNCLMWGTSYYLEVDVSNSSKVHWKPLKDVQPYTWYRLELERQSHEIQICPEPAGWEAWDAEQFWGPDETWPEEILPPTLEEVVGSWKDYLGSRYIITLDDSGTSCSATIVLKDGRTSLAFETIKYNASDVFWGDTYYLLPVRNDTSICWKSTESGGEFWWESCIATDSADEPLEVPYVLSRSNLQALLKQMVGRWSDEDRSTYTVTMDESGHSCTVETQRSDGRTKVSEGLLRYDAEKQCVMWGKSFYLDVRGAGDVAWVPVGKGKIFRWLLCQSSGSAAPIKSWAQVCLEEILGQWEDDRETVYTVSLDESLSSCSVKTQRPDGESRYSEALLTAENSSKRIWWASAYFADLQERNKEILWMPTKPGKRTFKWHRYDWC